MDMSRMVKLWAIGWLSVCVPLLFLFFAIGLDVSTSPAWQVVSFYLLVLPFCLMWCGWAVHLFLQGLSYWRGVSLGLAAVTLSLTLVMGWLMGDTALGFRSPLVGELLALFAVLFSFSVLLFRLVWLRSWRGLLGGPAG